MNQANQNLSPKAASLFALQSVREDLEAKKDYELETDTDRQYRENLAQGRDKFKTLREIRYRLNISNQESNQWSDGKIICSIFGRLHR